MNFVSSIVISTLKFLGIKLATILIARIHECLTLIREFGLNIRAFEPGSIREGNMANLIPAERIENKIYLIRGQKVMIDFDLAALYGVRTRNIKRQVKRNIKRFPEDFMFELNREEYNSLRCQFGTLEKGKHSKYLPYAFTEQGVAMLSSVLKSERAIQVNIAIMRVFVKLKQILSTHKELAQKLNLLEKKFEKHDEEIKSIFAAIRQLMKPPKRTNRRIGFLR